MQRYEKVGQSESESDWSRDDKKGGMDSQDEGETDVELSQVGIFIRALAWIGWNIFGWLLRCTPRMQGRKK